MKILFAFLLILFTSCAKGKTIVYTGSTPVGETVRNFLGIPLTDSLDFIRWELTFHENEYGLKCNYGIGKANTSGFVNGGKWIHLSGRLDKIKHKYSLLNNGKKLRLTAINHNLLHLLHEDGTMLVGNAGWSYTLNLVHPSPTNEVNIRAKQTILKDSMAFQGRTPCLEFANVQNVTNCFKQKWWIVLYGNPGVNQPGTYYLKGTVVHHKGSTGHWLVNTSKDGRTIYQLNGDKGNALYLLLVDDNILIFTDRQGNLLTGNEDFSFTLNRKW